MRYEAGTRCRYHPGCYRIKSGGSVAGKMVGSNGKWKTKDGSQPSKGYAVLMRVLGAVFALVGGMLIKWAVK